MAVANVDENIKIFSDPSTDIAGLLKSDYIIICDTNVYLGLYRLSPDFANFALECLQKVSPYLILPYTVKIEYIKHQKSLFKKRHDAIENSVKDTFEQIDNQKNKFRNYCTTLINRHFPNIEELQTDIDEKYNEIKNVLQGYFKERSILTLINNNWTDDVVKIFVQNLLTDGQIMKDFTRDVIYRICESGEKRYRKQTPPGFRDCKKKDGIRKYSDLILWKEIIHYAKSRQKNIIFVTDDVKPDWWKIDNDRYQFLPELIQEFQKETRTNKKDSDAFSLNIVPFVSEDFYEAISSSIGVVKSDAVDLALKITNDDYIDKIKYSVFDSIADKIEFSGFDYIDESVLTYSGSEGIDEWEIEEYELDAYKMIERYDDEITYDLSYDVKLSGYSYDYWGRDDDTKEVILSPANRHIVKGNLKIRITRTVNMFMTFEDSDDFDSVDILSGEFNEVDYQRGITEDYVPDAYTTCPDCGRQISIENDGGNGFCTKCAPNH